MPVSGEQAHVERRPFEIHLGNRALVVKSILVPEVDMAAKTVR